MKKILSILQILLILSISSACGVKGTGTPGTVNPKLISQGVINSVTSLRDSFVILAVNDAKFKRDVDALNKILAIAAPVNSEIQTSGKTTVQTIEDFVRLGANIAGTVGLSPDIVIAINLGLGVFTSLEPFFGGYSAAPAGAASDTGESPSVRLGKLQAVAAKYKK